MLIPDVIRFAATNTPDATALIEGDTVLTFAELWAEVSSVAAALASVAKPGDRAFMVSANRSEVVAFLYAAPLAGIVACFGNVRLHAEEIHQHIDDVGPSILIGSDEQLSRLDSERLDSVRLTVGLDGGTGDISLAALCRGQDAGHHLDDRRGGADEVAWIIHTSGTTGRPKGACLTHRSVLAAVLNTAVGRPLDDDDVYLFPFPLFHVASYNVVHAHLRRRPVVLMSRFDAAEVTDLVARHGVTSMSLAPTMISMLLDHPASAHRDLSSLRTIAYGASAIPLGTLRRAMDELGCGFAQGYGMTELSGNATFLTPQMHRRAVEGESWLLESCGVPGPLCSVRVVTEDGVDVAIDSEEPGEVLISGDQVFSHYWERPETTAEAFVDGWFRTGDVGSRRDGVLSIVDRRKDIIVTGGENVASREVEDVLSQHPGVASVAVVARPDERWGEAVCAVIVPRHVGSFDADDVLTWARDRLGGFKIPKSIVIAEHMPMGASGKVLKAVLRDQLQSGALD